VQRVAVDRATDGRRTVNADLPRGKLIPVISTADRPRRGVGLRRSLRQMASVPWVAVELYRCRRDIAALGFTPATQRAQLRSRRPLGRVASRLNPDELAGAVVRIAGTSALEATCLRRSLALWVLLRRGGREPSLRIGVGHANPRDPMHAWVELDGMPIGESPDVAEHFLAFDLDGRLLHEATGRERHALSLGLVKNAAPIDVDRPIPTTRCHS
jgi:hypothetical protein